jgi:putative acetyltransferase
MAHYRIVEDDLTGPEVAALLSFHVAEAHANSPACKVHALPIEKLRDPAVTFFAAWDGGRLAAIGALKRIDGERAEIKSMRAAEEYRGRGAGKAILQHLIDEARRRGYRWLGLETGRTAYFQPAVSLYRSHGFQPCGKFGEYLPDDFSQCMALDL